MTQGYQVGPDGGRGRLSLWASLQLTGRALVTDLIRISVWREASCGIPDKTRLVCDVWPVRDNMADFPYWGEI